MKFFYDEYNRKCHIVGNVYDKFIESNIIVFRVWIKTKQYWEYRCCQEDWFNLLLDKYGNYTKEKKVFNYDNR